MLSWVHSLLAYSASIFPLEPEMDLSSCTINIQKFIKICNFLKYFLTFSFLCNIYL